jgi:hypothetical protein
MLKKIPSVILIVFVLVSFGGDMQSQATQTAVTLSVDTNTVIQSNFLGVGAVYHGFAYMPESNAKGYNDTLRKVEFDRVADMSLHLARTWYRPDWACGPSGYPAYDWNSAKMTAFYKWLQTMKDRNVDVAINAAWWCTNDVYNIYPFPSADPNTWPKSVNQWAAWMSESLNQIIKVRGYTNVKYVMLFTEPGYESGKLPSGYTQYQAWKEAVNMLNSNLLADGRRSLVKLVGPNYSSWADLTGVVKDLNNVIDVYTCHHYNESGYDEWYTHAATIKNQIASTGKPFWLDEYGKAGDEAYRNTPEYGNYLAQAVAAFINAGAQSSQIWLLFDQQYTWPLDTLTNNDAFHDGIHQWGTAPFLPASTIPRPSYYAFALMSKYMGGPGTKVYRTTNANGVYLSATKLPTGDWSFLVVNGNSSAQDIKVNLSGAINKTLYRHLYNPAAIVPDAKATMIGYDKTFKSIAAAFSDTIPSKAVVVYSSIAGVPAPSSH